MLSTLFTAGCITALVLFRNDPGWGFARMPAFVEMCLYIGAALGAFGLLRLLVTIVRRRVALRVDASGIYLRRLAFRDETARRGTTLTPWSKIDLVVVENRQTAPTAGDSFLCLYRYTAHGEAEVARVPIAGWSLHRERLLSTAREHAPDIDFDERY